MNARVRLPLLDESEPRRPKTRAECVGDGWNAARPCPFATCRHSLLSDIEPHTGDAIDVFADEDLFALSATCSLDVAARGGITLEEIGQLYGLSRERIRQIESKAIRKRKAAFKQVEDGSFENVLELSVGRRRCALASCKREFRATGDDRYCSGQHEYEAARDARTKVQEAEMLEVKDTVNDSPTIRCEYGLGTYAREQCGRRWGIAHNLNVISTYSDAEKKQICKSKCAACRFGEQRLDPKDVAPAEPPAASVPALPERRTEGPASEVRRPAAPAPPTPRTLTCMICHDPFRWDGTGKIPLVCPKDAAENEAQKAAAYEPKPAAELPPPVSVKPAPQQTEQDPPAATDEPRIATCDCGGVIDRTGRPGRMPKRCDRCLSAETKRTKPLAVMLTDEELERARARAADAGVSMSRWGLPYLLAGINGEAAPTPGVADAASTELARSNVELRDRIDELMRLQRARVEELERELQQARNQPLPAQERVPAEARTGLDAPPGCETQAFVVRRGLTLPFVLPTDLTQADVARITRWLESLPLEGAA